MQINEKKLILAPMAGFSDQPFRRLCRKMGADEVVTELLSANAIIRDSKKTLRLAEIHPDEIPAAIQIFGEDPQVMGEAAKRLEGEGCASIDINMGCPAKKVRRHGAGSALLETPSLAVEVVKSVVDAVKIPVSVKIRVGKNNESKTGRDVAIGASDNGAYRITIHARTIEGMFSGPIDFDFVAEIKESVSAEVIGNGGIYNVNDAVEWVEKTGVDGLMVGRGAIGRPSIFNAIRNGSEASVIEDIETILLHCEWMEEYYGPKYGIGPMRGHLMYYVKGFSDAKRFRASVNCANSFAEIKDTVARYFEKELESVA